MANKFTWFPKLTNALERVPEGPRAELLWAIVQYGTNGIEPEFGDWALAAVFESLREDIDNSVEARAKNKGGRPRKGKPSPKPENGGSEVPENPETPPYIPNHTSPVQARDIPSQGRADAFAPEGFVPPTLEECRAYFGTNGIKGDPDRFWAHYESQGWVRSNGQPVTSLKAAAMLWNGRQLEIDAEKRARGKPTDAELKASTFKAVPTPDRALVELERRWIAEHGELDPSTVTAPRGTTADPKALELYRDARKLLDARRACGS